MNLTALAPGDFISVLSHVLKIRIIAPGKDKEPWITQGCRHYEKLISRFSELELIHPPDLKSVSGLSPAEVMAREAIQIRKHIAKGALIALSEKGRSIDSPGLAHLLEQLATSGASRITVLIGGPYGLDADLLKQATQVISLSKMTFSHQLVRVLFLEQVYRALSIIHHTPYHK